MAKYLLEAVLMMKIQPDKDICKPPHDKHEDKKGIKVKIKMAYLMKKYRLSNSFANIHMINIMIKIKMNVKIMINLLMEI